MKKVLSFALALMMLMTMCVVPAMAAEPDGSAENPYYVTNPTMTPSFITIPANSTVYYQYNVMVFNGWQVGGYGLSAITVDGIVYDVPDMWGTVNAEFNFNMMSVGLVGYVNDTAEEIQVMLTHDEPLGTESNPDVIFDGENLFSIPASVMTYVGIYLPSVSGEYTFGVNLPEDFTVSVVVDGVETPVTDGSLTLYLESYVPAYVYMTPVGMTGDIVLTVTPPKAGTADNPIWLTIDEYTPAYVVEAGTDLYFNMDSSLAGNTMEITSVAGAEFTARIDGVPYASEGGVLSVVLESANWYIELVLSSEVDNEVTFAMEYAEGTMENPIALEKGDNAISIPAGAGSYYYSYVIEKDGLLVATPSDLSVVGYMDMYDDYYEHSAYLMTDSVATSMMMPVTAGEVITFSIVGLDDEETWESLPVDMTLTLEVKDLALYTTFESAELEGWSPQSELIVDEEEYAAGWYSVKFEVTKNWGNMYTYINVEPNTDYEISFIAKATLANGLWVKFHKGDWSGDVAQETVIPSSEWTEYTVTLNSGDNTTLVLMFQYDGYAADGQTLWFDDIVVTRAEAGEQPEQPDEPATGIVNGDFEDNSGNGWGFNSGEHAFVTDAHGGNYALQLTNPNQWGEAAVQTVPVKPNTTYTLGWWSKRVSGTGAFNVYVMDGATFGKVSLEGQNWMNETSGNWVYMEQTVHTGDSTSLLIKLSSEAVNAGTILIDDITLTENKDPSFDGYIYNGDFESGKNYPWTMYSGTSISADAAYEGSYGVHVKNPSGGWGGTLFQDFTVEVGKKYVITMWAKAISAGQNIQVQNPAGGTTVASQWFTKQEWTMLTYEFTAADTSVRLNICGGGTYGNEEIYIDNVKVVEVKDPSFDGYIYNGDFECGSLTEWEVYQQTVLSEDAAYTGNFGVNLKGNGGWGAHMEQYLTGLVAGKTYTLSFWYKANAQGSNMTLKQNGQTLICIDGETAVNVYTSNTEWTQVSFTFVAVADGEAVLNFCGSGTEVAEDVYVDDILLVEVEQPEITYGDLNGDSDVNNRDLALIQQYINGWDVVVDEAAADVNGDGDVNNRDLALLQQYINGWDVTLGG